MQKTNILEKISLEEIGGKKFRINVIEPQSNKEAILTHYINNNKNGASKSYKEGAIRYTKELLQHKYPEKKITLQVAEDALQYEIFQHFDIPFSPKKEPDFKFIDLFAGIGGFGLALQNLGGKCVFTSEWDEKAKQTYKANFGETPFGDITTENVKGLSNQYNSCLVGLFVPIFLRERTKVIFAKTSMIKRSLI